jgi:3-methylcrotonyl-CoA carboxylase alpha subunit
MFANVLIANRGEIACRIIRTARRLGLRTMVVHTPADRGALFTRLANEAIEIGEGSSGYLDRDAILAAAVTAGAQCLHPGYGFLSENADFAEACGRAGVVFVGPPPAAMRAMGLKSAAKALMQKAGAPVVPGYHGENQNPRFLKEKAYEIGYPVLIKAIAGGGGRGMRRVDAHVDFDAGFEAATREARAAFGDPRVLIEKYILSPRHIEVQVFGDQHGQVVHLFERDCSLQRRHQKVIEESPAPGLPEATRAAMTQAAVAAATAVSYFSAGTVEFIVDAARGLGPDSFYFLEMNTRLQVEHPVTEAILGIDLVEWQFRVAAGEPLPVKQADLSPNGCAIEARLNAEDPETGFLPSPGLIRALRFDPRDDGLRIDTGVEAGDSVTPFYDSMIAKLISHAPTREAALARLDKALARAVVIGPKTNLAFLAALLNSPEVAAGDYDTGFIDANLVLLGACPREPDPQAVLAGAESLWRLRVPPTPPHGPVDPWAVGDGFELTAIRRVGLEARIDGKVERLVLTSTPEGTSFSFLDGREIGAFEASSTILPADDGVFVLRGGRQTRVALVDPLEGATAGASEESGEILAPMHGRLIALFVEEGQIVEAGARLAVVEAMKMEHALLAPRAGRIEGLAAAAGETVEQGKRLMSVVEEE